MDRAQLIDKIREAGIIGAGGAGFPTYKKLDASVEHIIANGAECEPLLYKDRETMLQEGKALFRGLEIMQQITGAQKVTIALKEKNRDIAQIYAATARQYGFDFFIYKDVYPAGDEYILVYEITGRRIPPGGIPLQVGVVVDNVETIVNIAHAVDDDRPVVDKFISITGAVKKAISLRVPVGTSIADCLELAGGVTVANPAVLTGGVMMGGVEFDASLPISKTLGGLIVLPADHYLVKKKTTPREAYTRIGHGQCDQCSLCTEMCPRYIMGYPIEPHKVMRNLLLTGENKERASLWAQYCCECNVCTLIACPEGLDPKSICVDAKQLLREKGLSRTEEELEFLFRDVHPAREGREVPIPTVYRRLGLTEYDRPAKFTPLDVQPQKVVLPLNSHIGAPAVPLVKVGDAVKKGQKIADVSKDQLGSPVHASIDGQITAIEEQMIVIERGV
ncbi:Respiratory-chain NADH dehydrogenase domain 51 kDa subunit [Caldithrix abyssi DSM 13497]|uniref:Na+-translocating ferredoxin:NAD+ oxidoreductase RNF, RnfC subunit n=1 Tax=Caldithrix abyssi DSM 13497 TaxID=880073 RepID=H1XR95_CALAY|nr:4Fe-4S dicluster domain-containing protein [Caldithrix abyssi]APF17099.1 Na+-translocating ferredoxin:NAD+ oxidoreductase RNF, RnfC subunit [Caldithrix abyssi DSM 13497]EHO41246.1 Respiratory-chain NADH dehydrogenase domain 51 kDa subunit [Caldithrix abyssi DSM 13497]